MAKTIEQHIKDHFGALDFERCALKMQLELALEEIDRLKAALIAAETKEGPEQVQ